MRWKGRAGKLQRQWVWALDYNGNGDGWNQHRQSLRVWISDRPAVVGDWDEMERTSWNYKGNGVWALTHGNGAWMESASKSLRVGIPTDKPVVGRWKVGIIISRSMGSC